MFEKYQNPDIVIQKSLTSFGLSITNGWTCMGNKCKKLFERVN